MISLDNQVQEKVALQTVIGLKFVNKSDVVLIQYLTNTSDSKLNWTVLLNTGETIRLKMNITAKDILDNMKTSHYIQISQTMILNIDYLSTIELKTRKCLLVAPFDKTECYISRLYLKNVRQQFELSI